MFFFAFLYCLAIGIVDIFYVHEKYGCMCPVYYPEGFFIRIAARRITLTVQDWLKRNQHNTHSNTHHQNWLDHRVPLGSSQWLEWISHC